MVLKADRWINKAPVDLIDSEAQFNWFYRQLGAGTRVSPAAVAPNVKLRAVRGVLDGIVWRADDTAAYVLAGECRGLMQFEVSGNRQEVEIEQLVTATDARGAAVPMIEWIFRIYGNTTIKLFPLAGSAAAYGKLGFLEQGAGGYLKLEPARSEMWIGAARDYRFCGPPPPPPDDIPPPPAL